MRPYRGKTKDGKWVEGWYVKIHAPESHLIITEPRITEDSYSPYAHPSYIDEQYFSEVIPSTVAQSTGLFDKNKKEIFGSIWIDGELTKGGDIIHIWSDFYKKDMPMAEVFWNKVSARFDIKEPHGLYHDWLPNGHRKGWFIEIIGNIHENPDLLKE